MYINQTQTPQYLWYSFTIDTDVIFLTYREGEDIWVKEIRFN